ncbi:SAVED domain-containing protein [Sulfurimonas microaerophilic]|uniref:SAVED domain-containing protein n=1 Tax=Sulfurimonas microaerophilic TaxID=3058392 RepID=UPI0027147416|nr:SAVED domain-containing protein [Sulfurimonas sp. hsl 1-7]
MNKFLNFFIKIYEIWQSGKAGKIGTSLLGFGMILVASGASFTFIIGYSDQKRNVNAAVSSSQNPDMVLYSIGILLIIIGALILIDTYRRLIANRTVIYFGNLLKQGDSDIPYYAMEKNDQLNVTPIKLGLIDSYKKTEVIEEYKHLCRLFKDRTDHIDAKKVYIASLASTPYLYLLGTLFRNGHIQNEILDYNRDLDKWYRLDTIGNNLSNCLMYEDNFTTVNDKLNYLCNSNFESIGIALSYTFPIDKTSIPPALRDKTIFLTHGLGFGNDKINNKAAQASLLNELTVYIDKLKSFNKNIHLFVSAQASFNVNLGKRYQDNTMDEVKIYNFNGSLREYDWFISFNSGIVK